MRALAALSLAAFALAGCAKFPSNGANNNFTRLVFRYTMNAPVDPRYLYIIAIRVIRTGDTQTDINGPIPVVTSNSKNGFVDGQPTHFVIYQPGNPDFYEVHRFATKAEAPDPTDTNPINLGVYPITGRVLLGIDPTTSGNPNQLGFDISTLDLATNQDPVDARSIIAIQFNILSMNRDALSGLNGRIMDALGDTTGQNLSDFNSYRRISIVTGGNYTNSNSTNPEQPNDTYNGTLPAVDLVDWTLNVQTQ